MLELIRGLFDFLFKEFIIKKNLKKKESKE